MSQQEIIIIQIFHELGISPHYLGYGYLKEALLLTYQDQSYVRHIMNKLYPTIAKRFNTTLNSVERNLRTIREKAFINGNQDFLQKLFYNQIDRRTGKITNKMFISILVEYLNIQISNKE